MVIGSIVVKKLVGDRSIPRDNGNHAYRGSTSPKKLEFIQAYPERKMKIVRLQVGTNSI